MERKRDTETIRPTHVVVVQVFDRREKEHRRKRDNGGERGQG